MSPNTTAAIGTVANIATILTIIILPVAFGAYRLYQRTLGSRRKLAAQLDKLSCNMQAAYIDDLFGHPLFIRKAPAAAERLYRTRHAYVQVVVDNSDSVVWWAVTTTDKHFKPCFFLAPVSLDDTGWNVQLNKSAFADARNTPSSASWDVRARRFSVVESYYFGNPGDYQTYLVGYNDAGIGTIDFGESSRPLPSGYGDLVAPSEDGGTARGVLTPEEYLTAFNAERSGTVVNTFGVVRPWLGDAETELLQLWGLGPDLDYVRVLTSTAARLPSWWRTNRNPLFPRRMRREWRRMKREVKLSTEQ